MLSIPPPSYASSTAASQAGRHSVFSSAAKSDRDSEDDKRSTKSRQSDVVRTERALETLKVISGGRVRHARCTPEFLEEVANTNATQDGLSEKLSNRFKIITGKEATAFFNAFLGNADASETQSLLYRDAYRDSPAPIVFAVKVWEAGRKMIDYYMTWRGKSAPLAPGVERTRELKGIERKISMLDDDFKRVAKRLDKEYKRASSAKSIYGSTRSHSSHKKKENVAPSSQKMAPLEILIPQDPAAPFAPIPEPPVSATDSVTSLPYLNMIRNVPMGNRLPLRVTNPDPDAASIMNSEETQAHVEHRESASKLLETLVEGIEQVGWNGEQTAVPEVERQPHHNIPRIHLEKPVSSVGSSESRSSRSSSQRDGDVSKSSHRHRSSSRERDHRHHSRDDRKNKYSSNEDDREEFLIVLLDEKANKDGLSWHGIERQAPKELARASTTGRHSPWSGPLPRPSPRSSPQPQNTNMIYAYPASRSSSMSDESDDESSVEGGWKDSRVIPLKPLMQAMGYAAPDGYQSPYMGVSSSPYQPSPTSHLSPAIYASPHGSPASFYSPANIYASPAGSPYQAPLPYAGSPYSSGGTPNLPSSSYVPAWLTSSPQGTPPSRPLSRLSYASHIYASPYVHPPSMPY